MPSANATVLCSYHYDPLDRLSSTAPMGQAGIQRFYQKSRLATEIQGTLQRTVFQHDNQLLAQQQRQGSATNIDLLATDQHRSVLHSINGAQRQPMAYTAYGHHPAESGLSSLLGFNGERRDPVTGHYMLGHGYRAFNPVLMRFNSPDSFSPFGEGGFNAYAYCQGDPVNFEDPTGHAPVTFAFKPWDWPAPKAPIVSQLLASPEVTASTAPETPTLSQLLARPVVPRESGASYVPWVGRLRRKDLPSKASLTNAGLSSGQEGQGGSTSVLPSPVKEPHVWMEEYKAAMVRHETGISRYNQENYLDSTAASKRLGLLKLKINHLQEKADRINRFLSAYKPDKSTKVFNKKNYNMVVFRLRQFHGDVLKIEERVKSVRKS